MKTKKSQSQSPKRSSLFQKASNLVDSILFPISCISCGKEDVFICEPCQKTLPKNSFQLCPICERAITQNGNLCRTCKESSAPLLSRMFVASDYQNNLLAKSIHHLKYNFVKELSEPLGKLMADSVLHSGDFSLPNLIIPVPLHRRRLRWRGFNQSQLLAEQFAKEIAPGIALRIENEFLLRKTFTTPQKGIGNFQKRQQNIAGCFEVNPIHAQEILAKRILLVDDVCTTGATLFECAKELKRFHPKSISAIVLARQS